MVDAGIEIGAHCYTHLDLTQVSDPAILYREVVVAREELRDRLQCPIRYFAVPYGQPGQLKPAVLDLARQAGYEGVCSAYGGYNFPGDDPFHLRRIHGDGELILLKNRATLDPRKLPRARLPPGRQARGGSCGRQRPRPRTPSAFGRGLG